MHTVRQLKAFMATAFLPMCAPYELTYNKGWGGEGFQHKLNNHNPSLHKSALADGQKEQIYSGIVSQAPAAWLIFSELKGRELKGEAVPLKVNDMGAWERKKHLAGGSSIRKNVSVKTC
jgi:hypothetical protein